MLKLNQDAPDFTLSSYKKGQNGEDYTDISLSDYKGKWLVLFFYPRDFTFVCPTELRGFAKAYDEFKKADCDILAASTDSVNSHRAWLEKDLPEVQYPVLGDTTHKLARDYGVLNESNGEAERGTFIVDPECKLRYILLSDSNVGRSVAETLRVVKALQSGGLCPIDWEPGQAHLKKG